MLRAMYTSITGLRNHQTMLDNVGNNIANVNTFGFKGSTVSFKTLLSQTTQGAGGPSATLGGTNNIQVGLGMTVDSIRQNHTQGALQTTGVGTDLAIQGEGFFRTTNDPANLAGGTAELFYTRAGNFNFDATGALVTSDGQYVVGYTDADGATAGFQLNTPGPGGVPVEGVIRLPVSSAGGAPPAGPLPPDPAFITYSDVQIGPDGTVSGMYYNPTPVAAPTPGPPPTTGMDPLNGTRVIVGMVTMSRFANPSGLTQVGNNRWQESLNSGSPVDGIPSVNGNGQLSVGYLEMSNVDLATEFTEMIKAQRGFQANSRVITTSDEILQELVNLKR